MRTLAVIIRRLLGAGGLLALLIGIPTALLRSYGFPHPAAIGPYLRWQAIADALTSPLPDSAIVATLVIALWIVWARFALAVLVQLPTALAGARAPRIRLLGPERALAAFLFAAIGLTPAAAASTATPTVAVPAAATTTTAVMAPAVSHERTAILTTPLETNLVSRATAPPAVAPPTATAGPDRMAVPRFAAAGYDGRLTVRVADHDRTVTVAQNDTLWDLAERYLDDPSRWREIYHLNRDRYDDNGHMHGGNHIEAGWRLQLPDDATIDDSHDDRGADARDTPTSRQPDAAPAPPADTPTSRSSPPATSPPAPATSPPAAATSTAPSALPSPAPSASTQRLGDDGVAEPTTTPTTPGGSAATDNRGADPDTGTSRPGSRPPAGIDLPTGGWIDVGLVAAILAAVTLIWAHRRRRYTHRPAGPQLRLREADTAALPATVTHLRRGLRLRGSARVNGQTSQDATVDAESIIMPTPSNDSADMAGAESTPDDVARLSAARPDEDDSDDWEDEGEDDQDDEDEDDVYGGTIDDELPADTDPDTDFTALDGAVPVSPALAHPIAGLWPPAGLGLTGPGGEAAARGFLTAVLATGGTDDPHARGRMVMSSATCATLLGADAVSLPTSPRLVITAGLSEALSLLEEHTLHRTRLVFDAEVDTVAALRDVDPFTDPLPPVVLIADVSALHERARVAALLTQGQRLDIHGILLGAWPDGDTVDVALDGATTPAAGEAVRHGAHPADIERLSVLSPAQTTELLQVLTEAHTGEPQPPAPTEITERAAEPTHADVPTGANAPAPGSVAFVEGVTGEQDQAHNEKKAEFFPAETLEDTTAAQEAPAAGAPEEAPAAVGTEDHDSGQAATEQAEQRGRVTVFLFGTPNLVDRPVRPTFRLKAMELLAYLAVQDAPVHRDMVLEDVLGDTQLGKAPVHLNTFVSNVRQVCKITGGSGTYVRRDKGYFSLDGDAFDLDVWHLRDALAEAQATTDPATRIAALRRAVAAYTGEFAQGCDYDWAEPYRQALRNQALDAVLDLAQALTAAGDHDEAAEVLQNAITVHPYAEQLYQQAMRAHATRGDITAVRTVRRTLTQHLAEIDAQPSDETVALADRLIASVQAQTPRRRSPRPVEET